MELKNADITRGSSHKHGAALGSLWQLEDVHAVTLLPADLLLISPAHRLGGMSPAASCGPCWLLALQELEVTDLGMAMAKGVQWYLPREKGWRRVTPLI